MVKDYENSSLIYREDNVIVQLGFLDVDILIADLGEIHKFNRDEIIYHLTNYYGLTLDDINSKKISHYIMKFANDSSLYKNINTYNNSYGREEFNSVVKKEYMNLSDKHNKKCELSGYFTKEEVHHIFPIVYGGTNSFYNLSYISSVFHRMLHLNPYEEYEEYCYIAYDHLVNYSRDKFLFLEATYNSNDSEQTLSNFFNLIHDRMIRLYKMFAKNENEVYTDKGWGE